MRIGVLVSGTGSNLEAILSAGLPVVVVAADRPCRGLQIAAERGVATELVERTSFGTDFDRLGYTKSVVAALENHRVDLVVMAGFMTILDPIFIERWDGRVLNSHPALLPEFKGAHAVADALAAGVAVTGCTVHIATAELDDGPVLARQEVPVESGDTVESLHERIKVAERRLYPATIRALIDRIEHEEQQQG